MLFLLSCRLCNKGDNYVIDRLHEHFAVNTILHDELMMPKVLPKYNVAFVVHNCTPLLLGALEPWCDRIYIEDSIQVIADSYIEKEQPNTNYDLTKRILYIGHNHPEGENNIVLEFDAKEFSQNSYHIIQNLSEIIAESGEIGEFKLDCFKITISNLETYEKTLIKVV